MKNKWLTYTLGAILTLVVLAVVAGVGFRVGMMQNASFNGPRFAHNFYMGEPRSMQGNIQGNQPPQMQWNQGPRMNGNDDFQRMRGFEQRGSNRRGGFGGFPFLRPIFGLIQIAVLGLIAWLVFRWIKNSGWRLTRAPAVVEATQTPAPTESETPAAEVEEKKESD